MRQCNELYRQLAALGRKFGAARIVLFGSRARGDNREHSDIDIAVYELPEPAWSDFEDAVDALPTLLNFDLIDMNRPISEELRAGRTTGTAQFFFIKKTTSSAAQNIK